MRVRYYDPQRGRFLTMDPWEGEDEDPATLHKYLYAAGDPVNKSDPTGLTVVAKYSAHAKEELKKTPPIVTTSLNVICQFQRTPSAIQSLLDIANLTGLYHNAGLSEGLSRITLVDVCTFKGKVLPVSDAKALPTPRVTDRKLRNIVRDLFKGAKGPNPIGTGSTADAVRHELALHKWRL